MEICWCRLFVFVIVVAVQTRGEPEGPDTRCEDRLPNVATCGGDARDAWYFDLDEKVCRPITGCNFSTNYFTNSTECESVCSPDKYCLLEKPQEPVDACVDQEKKTEPNLDGQENTSLWYFDEGRKKCVATHVLSKNTFHSQRHCQASCAKYSVCYAQESPWNRRLCKLESVWYFDRTRKDCFHGERCGNSTNRFETREDCLRECPYAGEIPECHLEKDYGSPCPPAESGEKWTRSWKAFPLARSSLRWYYDYLHGECRSFIYQGCGGNENNFPTERTCNAICRHRTRAITGTA
uniref:Putative salivary kunitz domain protein n=1 Tax=Ixodes ricinus TaxID=34613 RepID=A0A0K8RLR6_IXORI